MKRACCDWAAVNQGRPADRRTRGRTCAKHLRGRTIHRRPAGLESRRRAAQAGREAAIQATWARWADANREAIQ